VCVAGDVCASTSYDCFVSVVLFTNFNVLTTLISLDYQGISGIEEQDFPILCYSAVVNCKWCRDSTSLEKEVMNCV